MSQRPPGSPPPLYLNAEQRRTQGIMRSFAIDELRQMVNNFNDCNETFNQQFSLPELVMIHRCWMRSDFETPPHKWTQLQVTEALRGIVPCWNEDESPRFPSPRLYLAGSKPTDPSEGRCG
jgi:hypothetical protein